MRNIAFLLGFIAGLLIAISGVLTAFELTPRLDTVGGEVGLGAWRIVAGVVISVSSIFVMRHKIPGVVILALGIFEVFVYLVEQDFTFFFAAPIMAILSGMLVLITKN